QHHVTGLQIAMHHVVSMCRIESVRDLNPDLQRLVDRQRAFLQPVGERLTVEQLHHEERRAVVLSYVVERADMRVRQLRDGSRYRARGTLRGILRGSHFPPADWPSEFLIQGAR